LVKTYDYDNFSTKLPSFLELRYELAELLNHSYLAVAEAKDERDKNALQDKKTSVYFYCLYMYL